MKILLKHKIGERLPMELTPQGIFRRHSVVSMEPTPNGLTLRTEHAVYPMSGNELVAFPMRFVDGKRHQRNWLIEREAPYVYQLAVGDLIDPHGTVMHPRQTEPGWETLADDEQLEITKEYWGEMEQTMSYQIVTSINPVLAHPAMATLVTNKHRYIVAIGSQFQQPYMEVLPMNADGNEIAIEDYPRSGDYTSRLTGDAAQFAIHASGKGRYPAGVRSYNALDSGLMQPPNRAEFSKQPGTSKTPYLDEWHKWDLIPGDSPHPHDPRYKVKQQNRFVSNLFNPND